VALLVVIKMNEKGRDSDFKTEKQQNR